MNESKFRKGAPIRGRRGDASVIGLVTQICRVARRHGRVRLEPRDDRIVAFTGDGCVRRLDCSRALWGAIASRVRIMSGTMTLTPSRTARSQRGRGSLLLRRRGPEVPIRLSAGLSCGVTESVTIAVP